ncbi:MAG: hypothetical protein AAF639_08700 [Chloroflexota bacterium]
MMMCSLMMLLMAFTGVASAQENFVNNGQTIAKNGAVNDAATYDYFGRAVAISGNIKVVGAPGDDNFSSPTSTHDFGVVYVYQQHSHSIGTWDSMAKLTASDGGPYQRFGHYVDIYGDTIVASEEWGGNAYVFKHVGGGHWQEVAKIRGQSVAIDGDIIVTGQPYENGTGAAYVYARNYGGADQWGQIATLTASDAVMGDWDEFGKAVDISGDTIVVGAHYDDPNGSNSGSAYVFERHYGGTNQWGEVAKLVAIYGGSNRYFGRDVAISHDTIVIGEGNCCYANLFERHQGGANAWGSTNYLPYFQSSNHAAVAIDGDTLVLGQKNQTNYQHGFWTDRGGVDIYARYVQSATITGTSSITGWTLIDSFGYGNADDEFGYAVDLSDGKVVVGAHYNDDFGSHAGAAYAFSVPGLSIQNQAISDPANNNHEISVPVIYQRNAQTTTISSLGFSLDYDENCLTLLSDENELIATMPTGFSNSIVVYPLNPEAEVSAAIWDQSNSTPSAISDGSVMTMRFYVNSWCRNADQLVDIKFANAPIASFGDQAAVEVFGTTAGAQIRLLYSGPPTDILLDNGYIEEAQSVGTPIGNLTTVDPNLGDVHTYSIVGGDVGAFTIQGYTLTSNIVFDYDLKNSYAISVMTTDPTGYTFTKQLPITVTAPPRLSIRDVSYISSSVTTVVSYTHSVALEVFFEPRSNIVTDLDFSLGFDSNFLSSPLIYDLPTAPYSYTVSVANNFSNSVGMDRAVGIEISGSITNPLTTGVVATLVFTANEPYSDVNTLLTTIGFVNEPVSTTLSTFARTISGTLVPTQTIPISSNKDIYVIPNSRKGDCNLDGLVATSDLTGITLEFFDNDYEFWLNAFDIIPFRGSPAGCDANRDTIIGLADYLDTVLIYFEWLPGLAAASTSTGQPSSQDAASLSLIQVEDADEADAEVFTAQVQVNAPGHSVTAAGFVLELDQDAFAFDDTDADGDGLPDNVQFHVPDSMVSVAIYDSNKHTINVAMYGISTPLPMIADGPIVTVQLTASGGDASIEDIQLTKGSLSDADAQEIVIGDPVEGVQVYLPMLFK